MTPIRIFLGGLLAGALAATAIQAAPAPRVSIASLRQLPTPLPFPFDENADAKAQVAAAAAKARASGRLLLIDLGGNWCGDCRVLSAVMELPEVAAFVRRHYVVQPVSVGHFDRNLDVLARYGVKRLQGVPALLVIDRNGRLLDAGHVEALADARSMSPQALADWLARWTS